MDYNGLALVIGAVAGLITVVGGFAMQILTFLRQGELMRAGVARDVKLNEVHELVNGMSDKRAAISHDLGFAEGEKAGGDAERAR